VTSGRPPLRAAVVGAGFIGVEHAAAYAADPRAALVAIVDADLARSASAVAAHGGRPFSSLSSMLADARPEVVSVCVPTAAHREVVEEIVAAGGHILLEKPMAPSVAECDAIAAACAAAGVTLMLGFTHRFHPELIEARRIVASGELGEPVFAQDVFAFGEHGPWPDWYYDRAVAGGGGGAIGSLSVYEATHPLRSDAESVPMPGRLELEIHGTRGSLRYRTWHELIVDIAGSPSRTVSDLPRDEMAREIGEFLAAVGEGRAPSVGAAEGRRGVAVVQAIYASERLGRPVRVDELFPGEGRATT
jgi:predicted dehydrogenase